MSSLYQAHVECWKNCQGCYYCQTRKKVVLFRGTVPCDILFIGEAPGPSENTLGKPFIGPAGKLLDEMIANVVKRQEGYAQYRLGFTNLVACMPKEEYSTKKFDEPSETSIKACWDRLEEIVKIANPHSIVLLGKLAFQHSVPRLTTEHASKYYEAIHPAAILRADVTQKGLMIQRTVSTLMDVFEECVPF